VNFLICAGNQVTGYRGRHWTFRMFSGMGSAQDTNHRWHMLLREGQTGLSTAFDFPTLMGYDSDSSKRWAKWQVRRCHRYTRRFSGSYGRHSSG